MGIFYCGSPPLLDQNSTWKVYIKAMVLPLVPIEAGWIPISRAPAQSLN